MISLLQFQVNELASIIQRIREKQHVCMNKLTYLRSIHLCHVILKNTARELEDVYCSYILKPQIVLTQPIVLSCILCMRELMNNAKTSVSV
jgi:hypothetical protein